MTAENKLSIDWTALKVEFINGNETLRSIAKLHSINESTVRNRANKENWQQERDTLRHNATLLTNDIMLENRVDMLSKLNDIDLASAKALRDKANELLQSVTTPNELKAIAGTFDAAQKISRLALGASTENSTVTNKELPVSVDEFV